jgi:hypothetical protein
MMIPRDADNRFARVRSYSTSTEHSDSALAFQLDVRATPDRRNCEVSRHQWHPIDQRMSRANSKFETDF